MTPPFFYISDITNSSTLSGKSLRKKSMLENFPANVLKCLFRIIFLIYVGGTLISIKLLPGMYLSYQQAFERLDDWEMNHLLYKRLGQYSMVLRSVVKHLYSLFS